MEDITPNLIRKVNKAFNANLKSDKSVRALINRLKTSSAGYSDAYKYALCIGNARAKAFKSEISASALPDGKMYFNIGDKLITETLGSDYEKISSYSAEIQSRINKRLKIGLKPIKPKLEQDKLKGFIDRLSSEDNFDAVSWILDEPVRLFAMNIVDNAIRKNAEFQSDAGLGVSVVRIPAAGCCKWCDDLAGEYTYPGVPSEVFTRHDNCRCTIDYNGKRLSSYTWGSSHNFKD